MIITGIGLTIFGATIYYVFPLALLSMNLGLLLNIFFFILGGMLLGLALLSINLQRLLEHVVVIAFLWWDKPAIRSLTLTHSQLHSLLLSIHLSYPWDSLSLRLIFSHCQSCCEKKFSGSSSSKSKDFNHVQFKFRIYYLRFSCLFDPNCNFCISKTTKFWFSFASSRRRSSFILVLDNTICWRLNIIVCFEFRI
jgi:hypothetical protein